MPDVPPRLRWVAQAWLGSRLVVLLVGLLLAARYGQSFLAVANHWDAELYGLVAQQGYLPEPNLMAFFPGLPLLMAGGLALGIPTTVTGLVLSLLGSGFAAAALVRLARQYGSTIRPEFVAIAWLFAPTAVFTVVPYTESIFCAAAFWAWQRATVRDWRLAGVLAAVAASIRVSGVFLIIALVVLAITQLRRAAPSDPGLTGVASVDRRSNAGEATQRLRTLLRPMLWLLLPVSVVAAYLGYLWAVTGNPLAWYAAQEAGWMRQFTWPWQAVLNTWDVVRPGAYPDQPLWPPVFRMEVASMVLGLLTTGWCIGRRRWAEATWVGLQVAAFFTSYWFYSVNRATLLWFPLWIMLVELASLRPAHPVLRVLHRIVVVVAAAGMVLAMVWWCWLFFSGNWAS